jgi:hypothetical protein
MNGAWCGERQEDGEDKEADGVIQESSELEALRDPMHQYHQLSKVAHEALRFRARCPH